uniref:Uncharacterized protein n=1 Tax=Opuntia streptacantha TaxID=393608 RepID=A0A7C9D7X3_OPUST
MRGFTSHRPVKCRAARRIVRGLFKPSSRIFPQNHFRGPWVLSANTCMPSSPKTDACNTQERSAAMGATLRLLQLACSIHEELTNCHIICGSTPRQEETNELPEVNRSKTIRTDLSMGKTEDSPAFSRLSTRSPKIDLTVSSEKKALQCPS